MKVNYYWILVSFILGMILGALAHEMDMAREFNKTNKFDKTNWIAHFNK